MWGRRAKLCLFSSGLADLIQGPHPYSLLAYSLKHDDCLAKLCQRKKTLSARLALTLVAVVPGSPPQPSRHLPLLEAFRTPAASGVTVTGVPLVLVRQSPVQRPAFTVPALQWVRSLALVSSGRLKQQMTSTHRLDLPFWTALPELDPSNRSVHAYRHA